MNLRYKILLGIFMTPLVAWSLFRADQYLTGNDFIPYLKENMENVELNGSTPFNLLESDLKDAQLVMLGESHGIKDPQKWIHCYSVT